jgi:hypothetical protein
MGQPRIVGEAGRLGVSVSATSVRTVSATSQVGPAPRNNYRCNGEKVGITIKGND